MMKPLRKRHFQAWIALAILMPVGIVFAWLAIPNAEPVRLLQSSAINLLPVIKMTSDKKDYTVNLRANNENTEWQLEWKNKIPLTVPSAVIYIASPNPSLLLRQPADCNDGGALESFKPQNAELIGRIEARGDYVFALHPDSTGYKQLDLILYDFIHQNIIDSINLSL